VRCSYLGLKDLTVEPRAAQDPFYGFNYLFNERLYDHLHQLAVTGRIWASTADLCKPDEIAAVLEAIKATELPLGIVDGSNVSDPVWLGGAGTASYILQMRPYAVPGTLFINTVDYPEKACNWSYYGFTSAYLDDYATVDALGRLIEGTRGALQTPQLRAMLNGVDLPVPYRELPHDQPRPGQFQASRVIPL